MPFHDDINTSMESGPAPVHVIANAAQAYAARTKYVFMIFPLSHRTDDGG